MFLSGKSSSRMILSLFAVFVLAMLAEDATRLVDAAAEQSGSPRVLPLKHELLEYVKRRGDVPFDEDIFADNAKFHDGHPEEAPRPDSAPRSSYQEVLLDEKESFTNIDKEQANFKTEKVEVEPSGAVKEFGDGPVADLTKDEKAGEKREKTHPVDPESATVLLETETETQTKAYTQKLGRYNVRKKCWRYVGRSAKTNHWLEYFECGYDPGFEISPKHDGLLLFMDNRLTTEDCEYKYIKGSEEVQSTSPPYECSPNYKCDGKCENC